MILVIKNSSAGHECNAPIITSGGARPESKYRPEFRTELPNHTYPAFTRNKHCRLTQELIISLTHSWHLPFITACSSIQLFKTLPGKYCNFTGNKNRSVNYCFNICYVRPPDSTNFTPVFLFCLLGPCLQYLLKSVISPSFPPSLSHIGV